MSRLRINLLGPVEIEVAGAGRAIASAKERTLLAALAVRCGQIASADHLIDVLWGQEPPPSARTTLRGYIRRLRRRLDHVDQGPQHSYVRTVPPGYLLDLPLGSVDLHRFRDLRNQAVAASDLARQHVLLIEASDLWRGRALDGVDSDLLTQDPGMAIEEERVQVLHRLLQHDHDDGRYDEVITAGYAFLAENPLQEQVWVRLIDAFKAAGRTAEALAHYERARTVLADELGADPCPELQDLHRQLLSGGRDRPGRAPRITSGELPAQVRRPMPRVAHPFVGRDRELEVLDDLLHRKSTAPVVVEGAAGIGKTATVTPWACGSGARAAFPDGQLYLDLQGFHPQRAAVSEDRALAALLRGAGVAEDAVAGSGGERSALFRGITAGKRMLVVLDNARDSDHVRPLLPAPSCLVVATSRRQLRGLVTGEGAVRLAVRPLSREQSVELLAAALGGRWLDVASAPVNEILNWCAGVPLALRLVAERAGRDDPLRLDVVADHLRDDRGRLGLLDTGDDQHSSLRSALAQSHGVLTEAGSTLFRALGARSESVVDIGTASRLAGTGPDDAGRLLDMLASVHLIDPAGPGRFRMLPTTQAYAAELASDPPSRCRIRDA
jgi:DNA-binding SARP family transcriptional activator